MSKSTITMDDVARAAKVSKPTVSRALNDSDLVNEKTRQHVLQTAANLGYAINRHARNLRSRHSNTVAVSIDFESHAQNRITDPFIYELLLGVSNALGKRDIDLLLTSPGHNRVDLYQQMLLSRHVDGFIFLGQGQRSSLLQRVAALNIPMVVWGAKLGHEPYCVVGADNHLGGYLAGEHLIKKGRTNLLFIGNLNHQEIYWRFEGFQKAVTELNPRATITHLPLQSFDQQTTYEAIKTYLMKDSCHLDGIFAFSDTAAMSIINALHDSHKEVPKDVSVVGFNDTPPSAIFNPPITTIRQDTIEAGEVLAEKLMSVISGKKARSATISTRLIERES